MELSFIIQLQKLYYKRKTIKKKYYYNKQEKVRKHKW